MVRINYDALLKRIEEVSTIDTEEIIFVEKRVISNPARFDPIRKVPIGEGSIEEEVIEKPVYASVYRHSGDVYRLEAPGRSITGKVQITVHESELNRVGYEPNARDWYSKIDHILISGEKYVFVDKSSVVPETLNGIVYEVVFHVSKSREVSSSD